MLEIVVCDDNTDDLNDMEALLQDIFSEQRIECEIKTFVSANALLGNMKKIDIGILDIVMSEQNGIDLGRKLKEKFPGIRLIYTTSFEQYVLQAINDVHAYSYLCKPINKEELKKQMVELINKFSNKMLKKDFYNVTDSKNKEYAVVKLNLKDILYFEYIKRSRKVSIVLEDETYEYDCAFESIVDEFEQHGFAVNCRGNLVNLSHIVKIKGYTVFLDSGMELLISQRRIRNFKKLLNNFLQKNS